MIIFFRLFLFFFVTTFCTGQILDSGYILYLLFFLVTNRSYKPPGSCFSAFWKRPERNQSALPQRIISAKFLKVKQLQNELTEAQQKITVMKSKNISEKRNYKSNGVKNWNVIQYFSEASKHLRIGLLYRVKVMDFRQTRSLPIQNCPKF